MDAYKNGPGYGFFNSSRISVNSFSVGEGAAAAGAFFFSRDFNPFDDKEKYKRNNDEFYDGS